MGVVVNDSLILVDRFNKFRDEGSYTIEEVQSKRLKEVSSIL